MKIPSTEEGRKALRSKRAIQEMDKKIRLRKLTCSHKYEYKKILDVDGYVNRLVCSKCDSPKM